ncbi:MAG: hypothetical protein QMD77_02310 [Patescibacteria group bacterium]|nr:hypothetical protein [Patescibacteria group bacterium]
MSQFLVGKVPLRLSMGGGGTDIERVYRELGGSWTSATISLFVRLIVSKRLDNLWVVKYSDKKDRVTNVSEIGHPIFRESLRLLKAEEWLKGENGKPVGLEIDIISDVPTKSGLGVSGAVAVNFLHILHAMKGDSISLKQLAEEAYHVEHDLCGSTATGKQDQYIAAFGGIKSFTITRKGHVKIHPLKIDLRTRLELEENLVLFGTGTVRPKSADETLKEQGLDADGEQPLSEEKAGYFRDIKKIGRKQRKAILTGETLRFGQLFHEHWKVKKKYSGDKPDPAIDKVYDEAMAAGAIGGKVPGAGTVGAFWLFYVEPGKKSALRDAMAANSLQEFPWRFVNHGSIITHHESE